MRDLQPLTKPRTDPTLVFVLGLLSLVICQLCGPVAFYFGQNYLAECEELGVEPEGLAVAGRLMGLIGSIILAIALLIFLAYILILVLFVILYVVVIVVVLVIYVALIALFIVGAAISSL